MDDDDDDIHQVIYVQRVPGDVMLKQDVHLKTIFVYIQISK